MSVGDAATPGRTGPGLIANVLIAPAEAFATIRERPMWVWTLAAAIVLAAIGAILQMPATQHMIATSIPAEIMARPEMAGLPPDQAKAKIDAAMGVANGFARFGWLFVVAVVPIAVTVEALALLAAKALLHKPISFARLFAIAAAVQLVSFGFYALFIGIFAALRAPDAFNSQADLLRLVPSLAWVAPASAVKLSAFLAHFNPFGIWGTALLASGLRVAADFPNAAAWTTAILILVAGAGIGSIFAR